MTQRSGPPAGDATAALVTWLVTGAVGPALVALPVNWAADKIASAAVRWFKRLRKTDDLSRLVKAAAGLSIDLSNDEFHALRALLEKEETWKLLAGGPLDELAGKIADRVPRLTCEAAEAIARGLVEFGVFDLAPEIFQKVVAARLGQMTHQASAIDQALFGMHKDLYHLVDDVRDLFRLVSDRLPPGPADLGEITIYLKALAAWLNADPWPQDPRLRGSVLTPAAIERQLRVNVRGQYTEADDLVRRCSRLVILGGPGSGKTWLAMRTARACAEEALRLLDGDASLYDVELPLYTTCSRLISTPGDIREAVVSSALNWIADLGGSRIVNALRLRFTERDAPTLLVIDSLDEASDPGIARDRLRQISSLTARWRIMLTSRPSSWNGQLTIDDVDHAQQVGDLQPLRYPDDVVPAVRQWFAGSQERGLALIGQLDDRPGLREAATVPLILAFYCIVGGQQPLPEFRHSLHEQVISRLLRAPWRSGSGPLPDVGACRAALRAWAWQGAANHPLSGVGQWPDDIFAQDIPLSPAGQVAVDHVAAPMAGPDFDTDQTPRRFVHRSIREHLAAEYVAGLPSSEAVDALLPHLWYDPDWEYAAAAAIARHPEHDQVLRALLLRAGRSGEMPIDLAAIDAGGAIRGLLARVAAESKETDWSAELAQIIGLARIDLARHGVLRDLAEPGYWPTSTGPIREALPELLAAQTDTVAKEELARTLARLDPPRRDEYLAEARRARQAIERMVEGISRDRLRLPEVASEVASEPEYLDLYDTLMAAFKRDPSLPDVDHVNEALLKLRDRSLDSMAAWWMARSLPEIDPMSSSAILARQALLSRLHEAHGMDFSMLVAALAALAPTDDEKLLARRLVSERLADPADFPAVSASALVELDPTVRDLSAWRSWLAPPPVGLLTAVRRNSTLEEWLDLLPSLAGLET